jgi:hypothetical protein
MKPQPTNTQTTSSVCLQAAEILREKGWVQDVMHSDQGYCMVGAIEAAARGSHHFRFAVQDAVNRHLGRHKSDALSVWNDMPGRTREEVIAALEAAAWENRGQ